MIETNRLLLTQPTLGDFEDSFAMGRDDAVAKYIGGKAATREDAWKKLLQKIGH